MLHNTITITLTDVCLHGKLTCQGLTFGIGASTNFFGSESSDWGWSGLAGLAGSLGVCGVLCGRGGARRSRSRRGFPGRRPCAITGTNPSSSSSTCCTTSSGISSGGAVSRFSMFSLLLSAPRKFSTDAYEGPAPSADTRAAMPPLPLPSYISPGARSAPTDDHERASMPLNTTACCRVYRESRPETLAGRDLIEPALKVEIFVSHTRD